MSSPSNFSVSSSSSDNTFDWQLYPVFITSPLVTSKIIDKFLVESEFDYVEDEGEAEDEDEDERHPWCILRKLSDGPDELRRIEAIEDPPLDIGVAKPPTSPNEELDFEGYSLDQLATYVIENFCPYKEHLGKWVRNPWKYGPINDVTFLVLDERTAHDGTVLMVEIPSYSECDQQDIDVHKVKRDWVRRDRYDDPRLWADDQCEHELVTARVRMAETFKVPVMNEWGKFTVINCHYDAEEYDNIVQKTDWVPRSWNWRPRRKGYMTQQRYQ